MPTWDSSDNVSGLTLISAIDRGLDLGHAEWEQLWRQASHYQRRVARLRRDPTLAPHGRPSTYTNWGCRCTSCTTAYAADNRARKLDRFNTATPTPTATGTHGHLTWAKANRCACDACKTVRYAELRDLGMVPTSDYDVI